VGKPLKNDKRAISKMRFERIFGKKGLYPHFWAKETFWGKKEFKRDFTPLFGL